MRAIIVNACETLGGLWSLMRLAAQMRFRFSGRYWRWREETAFGGEGELSKAQRRRAAMHYARWMWRMGRDAA